jgi:hypothetical protein
MSAVILLAGCATVVSSGSVYRGRCTHVGIRPAVEGTDGVAVTVQVTTDAPVCRP